MEKKQNIMDLVHFLFFLKNKICIFLNDARSSPQIGPLPPALFSDVNNTMEKQKYIYILESRHVLRNIKKKPDSPLANEIKKKKKRLKSEISGRPEFSSPAGCGTLWLTAKGTLWTT